jgi:hypothetical protein
MSQRIKKVLAFTVEDMLMRLDPCTQDKPIETFAMAARTDHHLVP